MICKKLLGETGRPCVRCGTPMVNIFRLTDTIFLFDMRTVFGPPRPLKTLVCPECGEVCFYLEDIPDDIDDIPDKFTNR